MIRFPGLRFFFFLAVMQTTAQTSDRVSIEGGAIFDKNFSTSKVFRDDGRSTTFYEWNVDYYLSGGYFLKSTYDKKLFTKGGWSLFLPMGLSYLSQVNTYKETGFTYGCFSSRIANDLVRITSRIMTFNIGPALQFSKMGWTTGLGLAYNHGLLLSRETRRRSLSDNNHVTAQEREGKMHNYYFSGHLSLAYRVSDQISFGPVCEVFFSSLPYVIQQIKGTAGPLYPDMPVSNLSGNNIWINPGVRLILSIP